MELSANPFHEDDLDLRNRPESCTIVIFGATGDLTHRKLIPALFHLAAAGELPAGLRVVGFARRPKSDEEFRAGLEEQSLEKLASHQNSALWSQFSRAISYHTSEFQDAAGYDRESFGKFMDGISPVLAPEDIARLVMFIVTQPAGMHVCDVMVRPTRQEYP